MSQQMIPCSKCAKELTQRSLSPEGEDGGIGNAAAPSTWLKGGNPAAPKAPTVRPRPAGGTPFPAFVGGPFPRPNPRYAVDEADEEGVAVGREETRGGAEGGNAVVFLATAPCEYWARVERLADAEP